MDLHADWKKKFFTLGVVLLLVATGFFGLHRHARTQAFHQVALQQQLLTAQTAARIESRLQQISTGLAHLAGEIPQGERATAARQLKLLFQTLSEPGLAELLLIDESGNLLAEYPASELAKHHFPSHLLGSAAGKNVPCLPISVGQDCFFLLRQPVGKTPWHFLALISMQKLIADCLQPLGKQAEFGFLLDDSGTFQLHRRPELTGRLFTETAAASAADLQAYQCLAAFCRGDYTPSTQAVPPLFPASLLNDNEGEPPTLLTGAPLQVAGNRWSLGLVLPASALTDFDGGNTLFLAALTLVFLASLGIASQAARLLQLPHLLKLERTVRQGEIDRLQETLALTERRYRNLLDNAGDAIFFIDPATGALLEVNRQAEELLGYQASEIRSLSPAVLFPGRNHPRYLRLMSRVLRSGYGEETDLIFRCKSGRLFTGAVHARLGDLGETQVVHGVLRDISEIKLIEQELRQKNRDLLLMNEIADHAAASRDLQEMLYPILNKVIVGFGVEGGGIFVVEEESTGLRLVAHYGIGEEVRQEIESLALGEGLIGRVAASGQVKTSADLVKDQRVYSEAVRRAGWGGFQAVPLTTNDRPVGVLFLFGRDKRVLNCSQMALLEAIGKQVGTAVAGARHFTALQRQVRLTQTSNQDLEHSRRQLRENLAKMEESNRALAQIDRMKNNFLSLASHELRTPLTYILSGTELLAAQLGDRLREGEVRILEAVFEGGKRLQTIVDDLLEVARIESRSLYLARERIDLPQLLQAIAQEFAPIFAERQLCFRLTGSAAVGGLYGDPFHLKRTFRRLLENAVKFTPEGGWVEIRTTLQTPKEVHLLETRLHAFSPNFFTNHPTGQLLQVSICDSGVGIDPEDQFRVFEKFTEIGEITSHSTSRTRFGGKGVGLGLTLVKGMVEAHGGMVWVESAGTGQGTGSAFHILLPLAPEAVAEAEDADATG